MLVKCLVVIVAVFSLSKAATAKEGDVGVQACQPAGPTCTPSEATTLRSRAYPLCFFDVELGAVTMAKEYWPSYSKQLSLTLRAIAGEQNAQILSSRLVVARMTDFRHRQLRRIWPEIACVGTSGGEASTRRRTACLEYVRASLVEPTERRRTDVPEPVCQTFLDVPPRQ